ncbi:hypothetical protein APHAL10511_000040 [Amanita phalloides]|nr:hypothetical protein APHAL10511_000040 [Amanita phalloides]
MLARRPDVCAHIRRLVVRPNYYLSWPRRDKHLDEEWLARMIETVAPGLRGLTVFDWDGLELPGDPLWEALRVSCPQLRSISTNLGSRLVHSRSKLFQFSHLVSFSLIVRHNVARPSPDGEVDMFPLPQQLPDTFWDMILHRCPDLGELTICSFSPYTCTFDISPLLDRKESDIPTFPRLTNLTLGSFGYQSDFTLGPPYDPSFGRFLAQHPSLTHLRLLWNFRRWISPDTVPMSLTSQALPRLDTFVGIYQQLAEIPVEHRRRIRTVDLTCEPVYEMRVDKVSEVLATMSGMRSLDVWVHVGDNREEHGPFFARLVGALGGLEEIHFMCTTAFSKKPLDELLTYVKGMHQLRRFSLTKGHRYRGDESMLGTAERIVRACGQIKTVSVRWAREKCPNHLKQEGVYEVEESGWLSAHERGIPFVGRPFERRYRRRLQT